ncbi:NAD(P)-binding domain-containing protein [Shigella sonnei]
MKEFVESLETPRRILLMVKAGAGTDAAIDSLKPYLDKGDIIIDGGNASSRTPFVVPVTFCRRL